MNKKVILIDVDYTIVEPKIIFYLNKFMKTNYKMDDFKNYYIDDIVPENKKEKFIEYLVKHDLYKNQKVYNDAIDVIQRLNQNYEVLFCTSCTMKCETKFSGLLFKYKFDFLRKNFPFVSQENIILCSNKQHFAADIQIDDKLSNLENKLIKTKIIYTAYHNKNLSDDYLTKIGVKRMNSWLEIENYLKSIEK